MKYGLALMAVAVLAAAGCSSQPTATQPTAAQPAASAVVSYAVPSWMILRKGARVIIPEGPWPNASFSSRKPAVVTSEAQWKRTYDEDGVIPITPTGSLPGSRAVVTSDFIQDQSYGGGGAFLDGFVNVAGSHWKGVTLVKQLIPVVPAGTKVVLVPDLDTASLYSAATSTGGGVSIARGTHMRVLYVVISTDHPSTEKSPRAYVRILDGRASGESGWMDLTNLAIEGIKPDDQNDTTVNDNCRCEFIEMIPDFVASRYSRF
jgi:hypothetical protein